MAVVSVVDLVEEHVRDDRVEPRIRILLERSGLRQKIQGLRDTFRNDALVLEDGCEERLMEGLRGAGPLRRVDAQQLLQEVQMLKLCERELREEAGAVFRLRELGQVVSGLFIRDPRLDIGWLAQQGEDDRQLVIRCRPSGLLLAIPVGGEVEGSAAREETGVKPLSKILRGELKQLGENAAHGPNVDGLRVDLLQEEFRRPIFPSDNILVRKIVPIDQVRGAGQSEVPDPQGTVAREIIDEDVRGLQIAMDDISRVHIGCSREQVTHPPAHLLDRKLMGLAQILVEVFVTPLLHHVEVDAATFESPEHLDHIRVVELALHRQLPPQGLDGETALEVHAHSLHREARLGVVVIAREDPAKGSRPQFAQHAQRGQRADWCGRCLPVKVRTAVLLGPRRVDLRGPGRTIGLRRGRRGRGCLAIDECNLSHDCRHAGERTGRPVGA
mmetsp:Transcript_139198/g.444868  ORF Transcript_139198/g.444868 Transcript_139198/m.444868 type:complete len:443 (+) Transcript_139198:1295-2623(+)